MQTIGTDKSRGQSWYQWFLGSNQTASHCWASSMGRETLDGPSASLTLSPSDSKLHTTGHMANEDSHRYLQDYEQEVSREDLVTALGSVKMKDQVVEEYWWKSWLLVNNWWLRDDIRLPSPALQLHDFIICVFQMQRYQGHMPSSHLYISVSLEGTSGKHQAVMCMSLFMHAEVRGQSTMSFFRRHPLVVIVGECVLSLDWLAVKHQGSTTFGFCHGCWRLNSGLGVCLPCQHFYWAVSSTPEGSLKAAGSDSKRRWQDHTWCPRRWKLENQEEVRCAQQPEEGRGLRGKGGWGASGLTKTPHQYYVVASFLFPLHQDVYIKALVAARRQVTYREPGHGCRRRGALHWWPHGTWCTLVQTGADCPLSSPGHQITSLQTGTN